MNRRFAMNLIARNGPWLTDTVRSTEVSVMNRRFARIPIARNWPWWLTDTLRGTEVSILNTDFARILIVRIFAREKEDTVGSTKSKHLFYREYHATIRIPLMLIHSTCRANTCARGREGSRTPPDEA